MSVISKKFGENSFEVLYLVDEEHDGMRLDQFMQIYLPSFSRQQIKEKIKLGEVTIINRPGKHRPNSKVYHRLEVRMAIKKGTHEDEWWRGEKLKLDMTPKVIFEDEDLLVVSKPPYMATHPTGRHLFNCATVFFEAKKNHTMHSIHRLDRETSGVLLLGKNPKGAQKFTQYFENNLVRKCYFFIAVENKDYHRKEEFIAEDRLGTDEKGLKRVYINHFPKDSEEGKEAKTIFKTLYHFNGYVLGLAFPFTGRQHQIRVHAMINGLPLLGDKLYLGNYQMFQRFKDQLASSKDHDFMELSRHALHAIAINLPHGRENSTFISPIPEDLLHWIKDKMDIEINILDNIIKEKIADHFKSSPR